MHLKELLAYTRFCFVNQFTLMPWSSSSFSATDARTLWYDIWRASLSVSFELMRALKACLGRDEYTVSHLQALYTLPMNLLVYRMHIHANSSFVESCRLEAFQHKLDCSLEVLAMWVLRYTFFA